VASLPDTGVVTRCPDMFRAERHGTAEEVAVSGP
jgi:hypothetical protein